MNTFESVAVKLSVKIGEEEEEEEKEEEDEEVGGSTDCVGAELEIGLGS